MHTTLNGVDVEATAQFDAAARAERMLHAERERADRVLSRLLLAHFPVAVALAAWHGYWAVAIVAGSLLSVVPLLVVKARPATLVSRLTVATAFMGYSALLIFESHGATIAHFHVFVGLAFTQLYRDWRVPVAGGVVIALHHVLFHFLQTAGTGVWVFDKRYPGVLGIEVVALHAGFVIFEVAVLALVAVRLAAEIRAQAELLTGQERDQAAMRVLAEGLRNRDLTVGGSAGTHDGDSALVTLRGGIDHVAELVRAIERTAESVASASRELATTTAEAGRATSEVAGSLAQMADGADRQVNAVALARESVEQVGQAVSLSSTHASRTSDAVERVREAADQGIAAALEVSAAVQAANECSTAATEAINELVAKSHRIGAIVETITGIADQTNLLSLNAAIEAARAGESGRGFAVVADEVRKLAEESQTAASTISVIVQEIQSEMEHTVSVVEDGVRRSAESATTAELARGAFGRIEAAVLEVSGHSNEIAGATTQITESAERMRAQMDSIVTVAEQASEAVGQASASTQQTSASTQQVAASAQTLAAAADELQELVRSFRLADVAVPR
jgi:methyl-accepting chemotaxis protein